MRAPRYCFKPLMKTDLVSLDVTEKPRLPINSNPFHYDACSMGTPLTNGWIVLHEGDRTTTAHGSTYFHLYNQATGQNFELELNAKYPVEQPVQSTHGDVVLYAELPTYYRIIDPINPSQCIWKGYPCNSFSRDLRQQLNEHAWVYLERLEVMVKLPVFLNTGWLEEELEQRGLKDDFDFEEYQRVYAQLHAGFNSDRVGISLASTATEEDNQNYYAV